MLDVRKLIPISLAMIEPTHPVNAGHVARLAKNFGVSKIVLVRPSVDMTAAKVFSAHGSEMLLGAETTDWESLLDDHDLVVGTTAIRARKPSNLLRTSLTPEELAKKLNSFTGRVCIVLGREATGLTNEELEDCDIVVSIHTTTRYRTLNIGHAAAILLYELSKPKPARRRRMADRSRRQAAIEYATKLSELSGYPSYKATRAQRALKQILSRSGATPREVSLICGLLRKAILAIERKKAMGRRSPPTS